MDNLNFIKLKQMALKAAERIGKPSFYNDYKSEVKISSELLKTNIHLKKCRSYLDESLMGVGHGLAHSEAVAVDAGAVIQAESRLYDLNNKLVEELIIYAQIAGLLHDIRRKEKDHTIRGSNEAKKILEGFHIGSHYKGYIATAIRNHEAFKEVTESENKIAKLISGALYDADKFRWGPDNFTTTVWLILDHGDIPIDMVCNNFTENIKYIEKIKETFRTETGKKYGPEFIDIGVMIGNVIYEEMTGILKNKDEKLKS